MKPSLARVLLIALLCLTLPLKGLAATGMGLCGGSASAVMAAHAQGDDHASAEHAAQHADHGDAGPNPCSHCSPCCAALAPWVMPLGLAIEPVPPGVTAFVLELRLEAPPEAFERPPRSSIA